MFLKVCKMVSYRQKALNKYESNDKWSVSLLLCLGKSNSIISHFYLCGAQTDIVLEAKKYYLPDQSAKLYPEGQYVYWYVYYNNTFCFNCFLH